MPIRELAPELIAQIAAGEVVTRPGDAVKELVENAVDALLARPAGSLPGAIAIEIADGGYTRIRVADNGCGIPAQELPLALRRHATSKIAEAEDLEHIVSLGFRGEALAAIAAVADVTVLSAPMGAEVGAWVEAVGGEIGVVRAASRPIGTTLTVERVFERLPGRRKFQRAPSAEAAHISRIVQGYALAYPEIAFSLGSDGRAVLATPGSGDVRLAVKAIFGVEVEREMLVLLDERENTDGHLSALALSGLIGDPDLHRATRNGIFLTVNRRPIESRSLGFAIEDAYATQLPVGRHPMAIIDITVPLEELDPNVHPTKREVRLQRERLAFGALQQAIRGTLGRFTGIPLMGDRARAGFVGGREWPQAVTMPSFSAAPVAIASAERERPRLGSLRILGQVGLTYIICEGEAGLYLVDQHAAHERVLLERLEHALGHQEGAQLLLAPVGLALPPALRGAGPQYIDALTRLGFAAEALGESDFVVRAVPAALPARGIDRALQETLESLDEEGPGPDWRERLAVLLSCKTAVKAGQHLEIAEMQALLQQLDEATLCATCSHGRPTAILLSHAALEREFGRR
ncbi:MAG: DNA mismatch repair endonuclease MutL [Chloroflexi bacterium]|nr:DNA mismatch repair endonuclease MutL [Chloroflexota bacterium]